MTHLSLLLLLSLLLNCNSGQIESPKSNQTLAGVFDGRTPCAELGAQMGEPYRPECIKIKWRLTLYKNDTSSGGNYTIEGSVYRGDKARKGVWTVLKGTIDDPQATVIQLHHPLHPLFLQKLDDNVFLFLDQDKKLMAGNADFSYALNRTGAEN